MTNWAGWCFNRLRVLDPYRHAFDLKQKHGATSDIEPPPHKHLFHCYMYEYHTSQIASFVSGVVGGNILLKNNKYIISVYIFTARRGYSPGTRA